MAANTVGRGQRQVHVFPNLIGMVLVMTVEIAAMTFDAAPALAGIDGGISVAVDANDQGPVDVGVTVETVILVYSADGVTKVAVDAERGICD